MSAFDAEDPYRPPAAEIAADLPQERLALEPAGRWRRFFNLLIDAGVSFAATFVLIAMALIIVRALVDWQASLRLSLLLDRYFLETHVLGMAIYALAMEHLLGATVGKWVTGTRVVDERGGRPTFGQIVGRTVCRLIPFEPFSLLFATDGKVRGWHDRIPRTCVVRRR